MNCEQANQIDLVDYLYTLGNEPSHPIQLIIEAGFVTKAEEWKFSSAIDYYGGKGLLEIIMLDTLIV